MQTVDIDLIGNTMREPERERLSLILNELGTGLAGRGKDLNEVIRRANPALRETDKVLEILARQNTQLEQLAVNSDTVLAPLARDRARVASSIRNTSEVAEATAPRSAPRSRPTSRRCRAFLDELEPTMVRLGSLSDETTPVLTDLHARAGDINNVVAPPRAVLEGRDPGDRLARRGGEDRHARRHRRAAGDRRPALPGQGGAAGRRDAARGARVLPRHRRHRAPMDYIYYQVAAINGFDAVGHYLRAGLIVNQCATYAQAPVAGCSAKFPLAERVVVGRDGQDRQRGRRDRRRPGAAGDRDRAGARARPGGREGQEAESAAEKKKPAAKAKRRQAQARPGRKPKARTRGAAGVGPDRRRRRPRRRGRGRADRPQPAPPAEAAAPTATAAPTDERHADARAEPVGRAAGLPVRRRRMRSRGGGIAGNPVLIGAATVLVILVAVFLSYNANKGLPFVPTYQVDAEVPSAAQLVVGNDVKIGGSRVGAVTEIKPKTLRRRHA